MSQFGDNDSVIMSVDYQDPAFEPQSGFDFGDVHDSDGDYPAIRHRNLSMNPYGLAGNEDDFSMSQQQNMFSNVRNTWSPTNASNDGSSQMVNQDFHTPDMYDKQGRDKFAPRGGNVVTTQSAIVKSRQDRVEEHYGNLTPPEEAIIVDEMHMALETRQSSPEAPRQKQPMDRSERARNAAIQRHAKTRRQAAKENQHSDSESENSNGGNDHKREKYREKNRAAAAKCRAKKKNHVERIEWDARSLETQNAMLKARVRELRNQHAELRDLALQHNPSVVTCRCGSLHRYNMSKAAEITSSFNAFANMRPSSAETPQDGHSCAVTSPGALELDHQVRPSLADMALESQRFGSSSSFAFAGITTPESVQSRNMLENDDRGSYLASYQNNRAAGGYSHGP